MTSKSEKNEKNDAVLADLNSETKKSGDQSDDDRKGNSVLSKINEDQREKRSDAD